MNLSLVDFDKSPASKRGVSTGLLDIWNYGFGENKTIKHSVSRRLLAQDSIYSLVSYFEDVGKRFNDWV